MLIFCIFQKVQYQCKLCASFESSSLFIFFLLKGFHSFLENFIVLSFVLVYSERVSSFFFTYFYLFLENFIIFISFFLSSGRVIPMPRILSFIENFFFIFLVFISFLLCFSFDFLFFCKDNIDVPNPLLLRKHLFLEISLLYAHFCIVIIHFIYTRMYIFA